MRLSFKTIIWGVVLILGVENLFISAASARRVKTVSADAAVAFEKNLNKYVSLPDKRLQVIQSFAIFNVQEKAIAFSKVNDYIRTLEDATVNPIFVSHFLETVLPATNNTVSIFESDKIKRFEQTVEIFEKSPLINSGTAHLYFSDPPTATAYILKSALDNPDFIIRNIASGIYLIIFQKAQLLDSGVLDGFDKILKTAFITDEYKTLVFKKIGDFFNQGVTVSLRNKIISIISEVLSEVEIALNNDLATVIPKAPNYLAEYFREYRDHGLGLLDSFLGIRPVDKKLHLAVFETLGFLYLSTGQEANIKRGIIEKATNVISQRDPYLSTYAAHALMWISYDQQLALEKRLEFLELFRQVMGLLGDFRYEAIGTEDKKREDGIFDLQNALMSTIYVYAHKFSQLYPEELSRLGLSQAGISL